MKPVRIAIIGAGAVAQLCHLPATRLCPEIQVVAVADKNLARARSLADSVGPIKVTPDYHDLFGQVDGVINALPHYLHASVTNEFLKSSIPVLVEKPMALKVQDAEAMVEVADVNRVVLQVGLMYRFCHGARVVRRAIDESWLGTLQSFSLESGFVYDWPVASGFFFNKEQAGGGVLVDTGSHMLDLLMWWLGDIVTVDYRDDSLGGVEAESSMLLVVQSPTGPVQGTVTLSRQRKLSDTVRIVGARLTIEYDLSTPDKVRIWPSTNGDKDVSFMSSPSPLPRQSWNDVYAEQLRAFSRAITISGISVVPGWSALRTVSLIQRCYRERKLLDLPWLTSAAYTQADSVFS